MERVPELALPCSQIDDYLKCHHRTFIQQLMEADAEIHSGALSQSLAEEREEQEYEQRGQDHDGDTL